MAGRQYLEWKPVEIHSSGGHALSESRGVLAPSKEKSRRLILLTAVIMSVIIYNTVVLFKWDVYHAPIR